MKREEFSKKVRAEALSRYCSCANCLKDFDRGYAINATRAAKPQYCSLECKVSAGKRNAADRLSLRFWQNVDVRGEDDCWNWTGRINATGYGMFDIDNRPNVASRVCLEMQTGGKLPADIYACHRCDNPRCVNPRHLFHGTQKDNMADASQKGRVGGSHGRRGNEINTSKLDEAKVLEIKRSSAPAKVFAEKFGVSKTAIHMIRSGKNWGWLNA